MLVGVKFLVVKNFRFRLILPTSAPSKATFTSGSTRLTALYYA